MRFAKKAVLALAVLAVVSFPCVTQACSAHDHADQHKRKRKHKHKRKHKNHNDSNSKESESEIGCNSSSRPGSADIDIDIDADTDTLTTSRRATESAANIFIDELDRSLNNLRGSTTREANFRGNPLNRCSTAPPDEAQIQEIPLRLARWQARLGQFDNRQLQDQVVNIPLYFHVIQNDDGTQGDVPLTAIVEQVQVLNDSFAPYFTFTVENIDESFNTSWFTCVAGSAEEKDMKGNLRVGGSNALNLYTTLIDGQQLGWAIFPILGTGTPGGGVPVEDGVVVRYESMPGGALAPYNEGDTAVHETGHWLGLLHTFEGFSCGGAGDMIDDTPEQAEPGYGCPVESDVSHALCWWWWCVCVCVCAFVVDAAVVEWMNGFQIDFSRIFYIIIDVPR
jgi:hypothetical protein